MHESPKNGDRETARLLQKIGQAFGIPGPFFSCEEIKMGNVNRTYKVNYVVDDGEGAAHLKSYLAQRINTYAFRTPEQLMSNIEKVTGTLKSGFPPYRRRKKLYRRRDGLLAAVQFHSLRHLQYLFGSPGGEKRGKGVRPFPDHAV